MRPNLIAAMVVAALLCLGAAKQDPREASFLESAQLERDAKVQYLDDHGHALSFEETVAVVSPDPLIQVVQPSKVSVRVPMRQPGTADGADTARKPEP